MSGIALAVPGPCVMISLTPDIGDLSPRLRFCSRQHSLEGDFDELFGKGKSRHTDQVAGALRSCRAVGLLAHLARVCCSIIENSAGLPDSSREAGAIRFPFSSWLSWPETWIVSPILIACAYP